MAGDPRGLALPEGFSLADTHVHSNFSDGVSSIKEILDAVERLDKLSVVAITDHNTIKGSMLAASLRDRYSFDIIVGEEIMTAQGEVIGLFLNREIEPGLSAEETIERIHEQGGLAIAPHLFVIPVGDIGGSGFWWRTHKYPLDGFERTSGNPLLSYSNWLTRVFYGDLKIAHLSGSDSHLASAVGSVATAFKGRGAADFRRAVESRRTWPVKLSVTILQLLAYARSSFEIITRHRRIMRESKSEIATTAEHLFWQELMHFDVANLGELRRRVLDNYLSIQKEASLD